MPYPNIFLRPQHKIQAGVLEKTVGATTRLFFCLRPRLWRRAIVLDYDGFVTLERHFALIQKRQIWTQRTLSDRDLSRDSRSRQRSLNIQMPGDFELVALGFDRRPALRRQRKLERADIIIALERERPAAFDFAVFRFGRDFANSHAARIQAARHRDRADFDAKRN